MFENTNWRRLFIFYQQIRFSFCFATVLMGHCATFCISNSGCLVFTGERWNTKLVCFAFFQAPLLLSAAAGIVRGWGVERGRRKQSHDQILLILSFVLRRFINFCRNVHDFLILFFAVSDQNISSSSTERLSVAKIHSHNAWPFIASDPSSTSRQTDWMIECMEGGGDGRRWK